MKKIYLALSISAAAILANAGAFAGQTFDAVKARGVVNCGVNTSLGGFSAPDTRGEWRGLDVDVCRAVAAALFGDATKVRFTPLTSPARLPALQTGEVDLLSRNTTQTLQRDTAVALNPAGVNFYDGQGFLVPKKLNVKSARDLSGATVCVQSGSTTELNLADYFRSNQMTMKPVVYEKLEELVAAFFAGRCDVYTSDSSQLASARALQASNPDDYVILPEIISKEPLGPFVRHGDDQWLDLVRWSLYAMIEAEELGVTSGNVDQLLASNDPNVKRLLGVSPGMGKALGVDDRWAYAIIKQVGNYGESFESNVGQGSKLKLPRGLNEQWNKGGLMYAWPVR